MKREYYKIPFDFEGFFNNKDLQKLTLHESISQYLGLIITTYFKEYKHDEDFGSEIWEADFDLLTNINILKERIKNSIQEKVIKYEKRLTNVTANLMIGEDVIEREDRVRLKKHITIYIKGTIKKTNENYSFTGNYYLAPLAYTEKD